MIVALSGHTHLLLVLSGAEPVLHHNIESFESDEHVFHHIMAVRQALKTGEMPDEALEEMIEDLMNA